jgi:hypothetical protein
VDWFDIPIVPPPSGSRRKLTPAEHAASAVCLVVLPLIVLAICTVTDASKDPGVAVLWLPGVAAALAVVVCRLLRTGVGRTLVLTLGCLWWSFCAGVALVVIDILIFPF